MKKLEDFADDINKCSKCGLCQSVCPVYKITGNDCAVSRGKFVMLEGVLKGDLKLNKNIEKYLDMCLKCGKCKTFCPSGIDVCEIFNAAKYECAKNSFHGRVESFFESDLVFGNLMRIARKLTHTFSEKLYLKESQMSPKLLYFKGCVNDVYPKNEKALKKILKNLDVELIEKNFECCGLPFLSSGNLERYEEVKKKNLQIIEECHFDYILTDCASCASTLKDYFNEDLCPKFINAAEFISEQNIKFRFNKPLKVTFHKPCHLENSDFLQKLFEKCENLEYIEMKDFDECCGFAGQFGLLNRELSIEISKKKAQNIIDTGADIVLTTCPSCVIGIIQGLQYSELTGKKRPKVMNIIDFLSKAKIIVPKK